jgi:hypothetical protein
MLEKKINKLLKLSEKVTVKPGKRLTPDQIAKIEENDPDISAMKKKQANDAAVETGKIKRDPNKGLGISNLPNGFGSSQYD